MTAWPSGTVPTTNLDAGSDSPASARADLKTTVDKVNDMIGARGAANGVATLDPNTKILLAELPVLPIANGQVAWQAAGTYSWTVPAGVTKLDVCCVGAGGGGGFGASGSPALHGGGGGGGGRAHKIWTVTPGQTVTVVVGAGGTAGVGPTSANGGNGAASTVTISAVSITGAGGNGGQGGANPFGGSGAGASGSLDFGIAGGAGGTGVAGQAGIGGASLTGGAPLASGYGFGSGGYGSGTDGPSSAFAGADGGVIIRW